MFLLDTNVISATRKNDALVADWIDRFEHLGLAISVISLGEILRGIHMKRRRDPIAAEHLERWLFKLENTYRNRIIDIDDAIAMEWGRIDSMRTRGVPDSLIAATAIAQGMTLVTRNVADFTDTGVRLVNPWATPSGFHET